MTTTEPTATEPTSVEAMAANQANWDERVASHVDSRFYDIDGFVAGDDPLRPFEDAELGEVSGRTLVHLQCHIGTDTLAWARRGAHVIGLDFSANSIAAARAIAARAGLDAQFVTANVYDAVSALGPDQRFDIVYTGIGALCWLPDLAEWARIVSSLLSPGGVLYLVEFHPVTDMLDDDTGTRVIRDYFTRTPVVWDEPGTYTDGPGATVNTVSVEWFHPIGEVISVLAEAGLRIDFLHEHDFTLFGRFSSLQRAEDKLYRMPAGTPRIPLMYSLRATRQP